MKYSLGGLYQFFMSKTGGDKTMSESMVIYWIRSRCTIEDVLKRYLVGVGVSNNSEWAEIGHYYVPIAYYGGRVLKYAGIATRMNYQFMMDRPGMLMLSTYMGDRITSDKHELFTE